uniref:Uncharacterized protein n=1 Tax=Trichogramma kaykai TaxID=54128 RepID=A0ABD2XJT9_9HYME
MDRTKSRCIVSFSYNDETRISLPRYIEDRITSLAEGCIEAKLCSFRPNQQQIGDNIQVEPVAWKNRTSQDTINSLTDDLLTLGIGVLSQANKTTFRIPPIDLDKSTFLYSVYFKTSGGLVDVVEHIQRRGDIKLTHFDHRYVIELGLDVVGGGINLEDLRLKVPVIFNEINGRLFANLTGSSARVRLALDYQVKPCRLMVEDMAIHLPEHVLDFSQLGFSLLVKSVEVFGGKPVILSTLVDQMRNAVGNIVLDVDCEKFRRDIFLGYPYEQ